MAEKRISGFKKFSDIKSGNKTKGKELEEVSPSIQPDDDNDIPMNPNVPSKSVKIEKPASRKGIIPKDQSIDLPSDVEKEAGESNESKVETYGKVAKFPRGVKASKAYNFLENVKVSKKSIWYLMVEKDNELQMVKYNHNEGVDLNKFVGDLKAYYVKKYSKDAKICKLVEGIKVDGTDKYSMIKNIPTLKLDNKLLITKITEDLIKLLSK